MDNSESDEDFQLRQYEQQARRNAAWGTYSAHVRKENYNRELTRHEHAVVRAPTDRERKIAQKRLEEFQRRVRESATTLVVGGAGGCSDPDDFD